MNTLGKLSMACLVLAVVMCLISITLLALAHQGANSCDDVDNCFNKPADCNEWCGSQFDGNTEKEEACQTALESKCNSKSTKDDCKKEMGKQKQGCESYRKHARILNAVIVFAVGVVSCLFWWALDLASGKERSEQEHTMQDVLDGADQTVEDLQAFEKTIQQLKKRAGDDNNLQSAVEEMETKLSRALKNAQDNKDDAKQELKELQEQAAELSF